MTGRMVVVGDVMIDIMVIPEGPLIRGSDRRSKIRRVAGGSAANQAMWLGSMGADVCLVARVGRYDDEHLKAHFRRGRVDALLKPDPELPTGFLINILDPDGERSFLTDRGANLALSVDDVPTRLLEGASYLVLSGYTFFAEGPRQVALQLLAKAKAAGTRVAIDPASEGFLREAGVDNFLGWTAGASIVFANYDEAFALSGVPDIEEQTRLLGATYERVVVKRGALGASIGDARGIRHSLGAPEVEVIDTTGAGDAFAAGFLAAEVLGADEPACLAAGIDAGTLAIQNLGGQPKVDEYHGVAT